MEAFAMYLLKSVIWLTGFALVYILFLRNERYFLVNRIYLIAGIFTSFVFPLISIHYSVELPLVNISQSDAALVTKIQRGGASFFPDLRFLLLALYLSGTMVVLSLILRQGRHIRRAIKKSEVIKLNSVKLIRTTDYVSAFSFFSYVFVNPSVTDIEAKEILNHELVHVRQKHWFDLVLVEMLCMIQWFNPVVWIYIRFIRQNHEYLADEVALQRTSDPAIYKAVLLNQIMGAPVISLTNSFNYSPNKKRFYMMKNILTSPYRKMKVLLILPVFAIVLYSFAKPDYKYKLPDVSSSEAPALSSQTSHEVKGTIVQKDGKPLNGAIITLQGTTMGTIADDKGSFRLNKVPDEGLLTVSYVGYKTKVVKPVFTSDMVINMISDTVKYSTGNITVPPPPPPPPLPEVAPPPPPPPSEINMISADGKKPLIVIDGVIKEKMDANEIDPESIQSMNVIKDKTATDKYGMKGKDGVIEITTKKSLSPAMTDMSDVKVTGYGNTPKEDKKPFVVVEELPEFPGGKDAMVAWITNHLKYPGEAVKAKIEGKVIVSFMVSSTGKVKDVTVSKPVNPALDQEAKRIINSMPDWKPAMQSGKPVDVLFQVPVEFKLK